MPRPVHAMMRLMHRICCLLLLMLALPATALPRLELRIGKIEAADWQASDVVADWQAQARDRGQLQVRGTLEARQLPPLSVRVDCTNVQLRQGIDCRQAHVRLNNPTLGQLDAQLALHLRQRTRWELQVQSLVAQLDYNSADGRIASEALQLRASGTVSQTGHRHAATLTVNANAGQAYIDPVFVDLDATPMQLQASLEGATDGPLHLHQMTLMQANTGQIQLSGTLDPRDPMASATLHATADLQQLDNVLKTYVEPLLAGTPWQGVTASGAARIELALEQGRPQRLDVQLLDAGVHSPRVDLRLGGIEGTVHWRQDDTAQPSSLRWREGQLGALTIGGTALPIQLHPRGLHLLAPVRIALLDGALRVRTLSVSGLGTSDLGARFDAELEPIDLALLSRTLGWPEFGGRLSGHIPGLRLEDRVLSLDGALTAQVFDGDITIERMRVLDPFGVLPRVDADLRLRRLDLETITRAFSFGRITGRLDGDVENLRLLGFKPVAMRARLYSTPGDRSRKRISQRAIDNLSSIGGGPTGLLSRGALSLFEDFAYARMGWSCVLANGVCRMDGVAPAKPGPAGDDGYVLVQGRWLPRIDVVGYNRDVAWDTFIQQLGAVRNTEGVEVR